tara:strand:- start:133 stop:918 length:786 start_codon:yes stop_codon:yes gene_type:complete
MSKPASREQLKEYALRRLGSPVIDINVDDSQMEDRLDDALQFFAEYHFDGVDRRYYKYEVTQSDIDANKKDADDHLNAGYISLDGIDPNIISVTRLFQFSESTVNMFDVRYQMALNDFYGIRTGMGNLSNYDITKRHLSLIQQMLDPEKMIRFSRVKNRLHVDMNWDEDIEAGDFLVFECYSTIDPEVYTEIYNDILLKKYYTANIKRQWGQNLSKFEGIQLPGGVQFNGTQLFDQAQTEIEKIEEEVQLRYELPVDFTVG